VPLVDLHIYVESHLFHRRWPYSDRMFFFQLEQGMIMTSESTNLFLSYLSAESRECLLAAAKPLKLKTRSAWALILRASRNFRNRLENACS
jgi:hypothetical protein